MTHTCARARKKLRVVKTLKKKEKKRKPAKKNSLQVGLPYDRQSAGMLSTALRFISSATFA